MSRASRDNCRNEPLKIMDEIVRQTTRVFPDGWVVKVDDWQSLRTALERQAEELAQAKQWVNDLQSGMYINCVYCGHRYGPNDEVPASMADILKEHIEECPEHPMSKLKEKLAQKDARIDHLQKQVNGLEFHIATRPSTAHLKAEALRGIKQAIFDAVELDVTLHEHIAGVIDGEVRRIELKENDNES